MRNNQTEKPKFYSGSTLMFGITTAALVMIAAAMTLFTKAQTF